MCRTNAKVIEPDVTLIMNGGAIYIAKFMGVSNFSAIAGFSAISGFLIYKPDWNILHTNYGIE